MREQPALSGAVGTAETLTTNTSFQVQQGHPKCHLEHTQATQDNEGPPCSGQGALTILLAVEVLWAPHAFLLVGAQAGGQVGVS